MRFQEIICEVKNSKLYSKWNKSDIQRWSLRMYSQNLKILSKETLIEMLCVLDRAVELDKKHWIREIEMFSSLSLICKNENQGVILQILTGEGKTLIIDCLDVLLCLQGYQFDIVTSSNVLAKWETQKLKQFYSSFSIKCSDNIQKKEKKQHKQKKIENGKQTQLEEKVEEEVEQKEITFYGKNMRRDQEKSLFTQLENDGNLKTAKNMEIEEKNETVNFYQKDNINIIYNTTHSFQAGILKHKFYKKGNRGFRRYDKIIVDEAESSMLFDSRRIVNQCEAIQEDASAHLVRMLVVFLGDQKCQNIFKTYMQSFLIDYINYNLPVWASNSVLTKYKFIRNVQYNIVKNKEILHFDYSNIGITQINTQYQDSIHQFLQLKEKVPLTNLNLVTNYSSNINFFRRYQSNLYGLTGTLGSETIRNFLNEIQSVDFIYIPPFKKRQLMELFPYLEEIKQKCYKKVAQDVEWAYIEQKRCFLAFCQNIKDVGEIYQLITSRKVIDSQFISRYTDQEDSQPEIKIQKYTKPGFLIVSTNLAGRSHDLKIPEIVEQKGELHLIVTYIPQNSRVFEQAFGRAGRQVQKGSARIVIKSNILNQLKNDLKIQDDIDDEYFKQQFCLDLKNEIMKKVQQEEKDQIVQARGEVKKIEEQINYKNDYLIFKALNFRFGMFLDILNEKQKNEPNEIQQIQELGRKSLSSYFKKDIQKFSSDIEKNYNQSQILVRPEDLLYKSSISLMNKDDLAQLVIKQAKNFDQQNPIPHYQQIICHIQNKEFDKFEQEQQEFGEKIENKMEEQPLLRVIEQNSDQQLFLELVKVQLNLKMNFQHKLNSNRRELNLELNQLLNFEEIQIQQIENQTNLESDLNLSLQSNEEINLIQPQYEKYMIQKLKLEQIESQKQLINDLQIKLDELQTNSYQLEINLSKEYKHLQVYESISIQLEESLENLKKITKLEINEIIIEFKNASQFKTYIPDDYAFFKDIAEFDRMMANEGLPLIGQIQTKKETNKLCPWKCKLVSGVIQSVVGIALTFFLFEAGSVIGISLIIEGCVDVFQSIKATIKGEEVDLSKYFQNKFVSLVFSYTLAGKKALQETRQLFKQGAEYAAKNGILNSIKNLACSDVILGGLKKAGQKVIDLNNISYISRILLTRILQTDKKEKSQEEDKLTEEQKQNFLKNREQISNELKNQFIIIKEKERQYQEFLKQIGDEIKKISNQQVKQNYLVILTQLAFLLKSNQENISLIKNMLDLGYLLIDIEKKDQILENAIQTLKQAHSNRTTDLTNLTPSLQQLLNELFKKVDEKLSTIKFSIFNFILDQAINLYAQKSKQYLEDSGNSLKEKQKQIQKIQQKQQEFQNLNKKQYLLQKQYQNIQLRSNQLNNLIKNLNQYDENEVNNYNQQLQKLNQQIDNFDLEQQKHNLKVKQLQKYQQILINEDLFKNEQNDINYISSSIKKEIDNLVQKIKEKQTYKRYEDILIKMQVFNSDKITLNKGFQNKILLENEFNNIFSNSQFSSEIVSYIFSHQFQAEQTIIFQAREDIIEEVNQKTQDIIIIPLLQQTLNKLISEDIILAKSKIKQLAQKIIKAKEC